MTKKTHLLLVVFFLLCFSCKVRKNNNGIFDDETTRPLVDESEDLNYLDEFESAVIRPDGDDPQEIIDFANKQIEKSKTSVVRLNSISSKIARLLMIGHNKALHKFMDETVKSLAIKGDSNQFTYEFNGSPAPNAYMEVGRANMGINAGLIAVSENPAQFAYVIAHEMAHNNPEPLKALSTNPEIEKKMAEIAGYKNLKASHREEIRADLSAIDRMIHAGFNPWEAYNMIRNFAELSAATMESLVFGRIYKRTFNSSYAAYSTHPPPEIRLAAMKAYIAYRGFREDLSEITKEESKFNISMTLLRTRMLLYALPIASKWSTKIVSFVVLSQAIFASSFVDFDALWGMIDVDESFKKTARETITKTAKLGLSAFKYIALLGSAYLIRSLIKQNTQSNIESVASLELYKQTFEAQLTAIKNLEQNDNNYQRNIILLADKFRNIAHSYQYKFGYISSYVKKYLHKYEGFVKSAAIEVIKVQGEFKNRTASSDAEFLSHLNAWNKYIFEDPDALKAYWQYFPPKSNISLAKLIESTDPKNTTPEQIKLALDYGQRDLSQENPKDILALLNIYEYNNTLRTQEAVFKIHFEEILDYAFVKEGATNAEAKTVLELIKSVKTYNFEQDVTFKEKVFWDQLLYKYAEKRKDTSKTTNIRLASLLIGVPITSALKNWHQANKTRVKQNRYFINELEKLFSQDLSNLNSLSNFIDNEIRSNGVIVEPITENIRNKLFENPQWIKTIDDIETVSNLEEAWTKLEFKKFNGTSIESLLINQINELKEKAPEVWSYNLIKSTEMQQYLVENLKKNNSYPNDFKEKFRLWNSLTSRGVTVFTDEIVKELYEQANPAERNELLVEIEKGKSFDDNIRFLMLEDKITNLKEFTELKQSEDAIYRRGKLSSIIKYLEKTLPDRGATYVRLLEMLSREIKSTPWEARHIQSKKFITTGKHSEDAGVRALSAAFREVNSWNQAEQWKTILFLRGQGEAPESFKKLFQSTGVLRIRYIFQSMPDSVRAGLLDTLLDSPTGLLPKINIQSGYATKIIDHVFKDASTEVKKTSQQILKAFLVSLEKTGQKPLQTLVLSYVLGMPPGEKSPGEVLKRVLETFGGTGIKLGQFLAAAQILPEEETKHLRVLNDGANPPERDKIYKDIVEASGHKLKDLPWKIDELLGAASQKYAVKIQSEDSSLKVLKLLRLEAVAHKGAEFSQLEAMANYLVDNHGGKYGVFRSIVYATKKAVDREQNLEDEVKRAEIAKAKIYQGKSDSSVRVEVPAEKLLFKRISESEFAAGVSIFNVKQPARDVLVKKILKIESEILFGEVNSPDALIIFDPDRHPGNYRIKVNPENNQSTLSPIDFGQVVGITGAERDKVFSLFALAQIITKSGANNWGAEKIIEILEIDTSTQSKLAKALKKYFPAETATEITAYFSVLAAVHDIGQTQSIVYYDYLRAVIQLNQYSDMLSKPQENSPKTIFTRSVVDKVDRLKNNIRLTPWEKVKYVIKNAINGGGGDCSSMREMLTQ